MRSGSSRGSGSSTKYGASYQPSNECVLRGPVVAIARCFIDWWNHIFDKPDAYVALFTALLVVSTIALWRSTRKLWEAGEKQFKLAKETTDRQAIEIKNQIDIARIAARAADDSAKAAIATERARFYIVINAHNLESFLKAAGRYPNSPTMPFSFGPIIEYAFKNYGKTPGIIKEVSHGLSVNEGPPDPVYTVSKHLFVENMIAAGGTTEAQKFDGPTLFRNIETAMPVIQGQAHFWFYGRFDYEDVFGNPQVHRFFMRYVKIGLNWGFQPYDHKHYNEST
jgi:hypothetical protein